MMNVSDTEIKSVRSIHRTSQPSVHLYSLNASGMLYGLNHEVSASWTLPPEPCGHLSMHTALHMPSTNKISLFRVCHGGTPGILPAFSCGSSA